MSQIDCPCKGCGERKINCHQDCKKYRQFKAKVNAYKKKYGDYVNAVKI